MFKKIKECFYKRKKVLTPSKSVVKYISSLPNIYIVACWAHWGVRAYPFAGFNKNGEPMVWYWDDHNGEHEDYRLIPWTHTTTGRIFIWTKKEGTANKIANLLNEEEEFRGLIQQLDEFLFEQKRRNSQ